MTRTDWRRILIAFSVMAVLWAVGGFIAAYNQTQITNNQHNIRANQTRIAALQVNVAAAVCLVAIAPDTGANSETDLVRRYVATGIPTDLPDLCERTVARARDQLGKLPTIK